MDGLVETTPSLTYLELDRWAIIWVLRPYLGHRLGRMFLKLGVYGEDEFYLMLTKFSEIFQLSFYQNALQCNVPLFATSDKNIRVEAF